MWEYPAKAKVVKSPGYYINSPHPWVFLAGSIEMGQAENWQGYISDVLRPYTLTILNPRRDDWDNSWEQSIDNPKFREQVEWELRAVADADLILMHFEANTKSPITLLELGLFASSKHRLIVHCPEGYWRKGNVDIVCKLWKIPQVGTLKDLAEIAIERLNLEI